MVWAAIKNCEGNGVHLLNCQHVSLAINTVNENDASGIMIAGEWSESSSGPHAFLWDAENGMQDLGTFGRGSLATDINDFGLIVGYSAFEEGGCHACLWEDGHMVDIDPSGTVWSGATAINNVGQVVGNFGGAAAFVWSSTSGIQNLNNLLAGDEQWSIVEVHAINDAGWIVGTGILNAGTPQVNTRAILLQPVPEPSHLTLLLGGVCAALIRLFFVLGKKQEKS